MVTDDENEYNSSKKNNKEEVIEIKPVEVVSDETFRSMFYPTKEVTKSHENALESELKNTFCKMKFFQRIVTEVKMGTVSRRKTRVLPLRGRSYSCC